MYRFSFCLLLGSLCLLSCQPVPPSHPSEAHQLPFQPHILWLVAEDLSPILPMYGDSTAETPNLSRLASEGIVFDQFFSPSGVCAPSRAAIATGMYPSRIGAHNMRTLGPPQYMPHGLPSYECLPPIGTKMHAEYMRELGYYCTNNAKQDYQFRPTVTAWDESSRQAHWRNRGPNQPFFAVFNFEVTHESRVWAKAEDSLWLDPNCEVPVPPYLPDTDIARRDIRRVYSNICEMDAQIGAVLDQLEADGLLDSTIIFWYGDHGGPLPRQKRMMYDSGIQTPLIVRFPDGWRAGTRDGRMTSFLDLLPTIVSLAGTEPPLHIDGQAFYGPFTKANDREMVFAAADRFDEIVDMQRAVRTTEMKYIRNFHPDLPMYRPVAYREQMPVMQELLRLNQEDMLSADQALWFRTQRPEEELYDLRTDPHELHNLAEDPAYADQLLSLRKACTSWMTEIGDLGKIPEQEYVESIWPEGQQPVTSLPRLRPHEGGLTLEADKGVSKGYVFLDNEQRVEWITTREWYGKHERYAIVTDRDTSEMSWNLMPDHLQIPDGKSAVFVAHRLGYKPSGLVHSEDVE